MTREEAIELLDQQTQAEALKKYGGGWLGVNAINKALQIAISALRAQQEPANLDRSRWDGCDWCNQRYCDNCFWQIKMKDSSNEEKGESILTVLKMETHNSVTKAAMLNVIRYLLNLAFDVPEEGTT